MISCIRCDGHRPGDKAIVECNQKKTVRFSFHSLRFRHELGRSFVCWWHVYGATMRHAMEDDMGRGSFLSMLHSRRMQIRQLSLQQMIGSTSWLLFETAGNDECSHRILIRKMFRLNRCVESPIWFIAVVYVCHRANSVISIDNYCSTTRFYVHFVYVTEKIKRFSRESLWFSADSALTQHRSGFVLSENPPFKARPNSAFAATSHLNSRSTLSDGSYRRPR